MRVTRVSVQPLELWAGVECTVNRVGDSYSDQLERNGHALRSGDLERLALLGVRKVRYPVLWERTAPESMDRPEWSWADARMAGLRRLGMQPIVGLVHHGSGPRYTNLLDPDFPKKLAAFAGAVARRYPWVTDYTPVNEPLTTARFSCLYGHWYPHLREPLAFARALLAQCRAVIMSMRAIRQINSDARLIQTEDLGKTYSTSTLSYQAAFENERRWLTFDLLCGRVDPHTEMWDYFRWLGVEHAELEWFRENQTSPNLLGINHYITSERFLDESLTRYPELVHGGNGRHTYADVEAVRVCAEGVAGPKAIMEELWDRYGLPFAITEVHLGCTREEQLRWLSEVWNAAASLRANNVDVRAVTAWAAFGTFDWDSLLTSNTECYEPGLFDLRSPLPRPTALARLINTLASGKKFTHPVIDSPGWWHRLDRFCYPPVHSRPQKISNGLGTLDLSGVQSRPLLITGATGTLGQAFGRICEKRGLAYRLLSRKQLDIASPDSVVAALDLYEPWAIINAAGYVRVDDAEIEGEKCWRENVIGPECLARECSRRDLPLLTFSSDLVFDGLKETPYVESDNPAPLNVYGDSKAAAEERVLRHLPEALIIRTSAFFGPWDQFNFVYQVMNSLVQGSAFLAADDVYISPSYVPDLVNAALDLLIDNESGIWHIANPSVISWAEFANKVAERAGYDPSSIKSTSSRSFGFLARRPSFTPLASERGHFMPALEVSLDSFFRDTNWTQQDLAVSARV
jgi:dTDP-4-dehydrorhamnose reductase